MQLLCEYRAYAVFTFITAVIIAALFGGLLGFANISVSELEAVGISECIGYVFKVLPVILALCAMQLFIYEAAKTTVAALLLQFLTAVISAYLSGCFYPNYFFPQGLRNVIDILPTGAAFIYMRKAITGDMAVLQLLLLLGYAAVFFALSVIIRNKRQAGDGE